METRGNNARDTEERRKWPDAMLSQAGQSRIWRRIALDRVMGKICGRVNQTRAGYGMTRRAIGWIWRCRGAGVRAVDDAQRGDENRARVGWQGVREEMLGNTA